MVTQANKTRHVSIRVPDALFEELEVVAAMNGETLSQCARRLLGEGLAPPRQTTAIDEAIATLQRVRRGIGPTTTGPAPSPAEPSPPIDQATRTVNVLNAKANLSRLLADVARGDQIVIAHAGSARARLVPVSD